MKLLFDQNLSPRLTRLLGRSCVGCRKVTHSTVTYGGVMRSVPGAVATGLHSRRFHRAWVETRSLPLPVLTSSSASIRVLWSVIEIGLNETTSFWTTGV